MNNKGIIYIMTTNDPKIIKIGITRDEKTFKKRMYQLEANGYRNYTGLKREFAVEVKQYKEIEKNMHEKYRKYRITNTELFVLDINVVRQEFLKLSTDIVYDAKRTSIEVL